MSDPTETNSPGRFTERGGASPNPDTIELILADFRDWLQSHDPPDLTPEPAEAPTVDLFTLVSQFTALRHEVNLQTKAVRSATEQITTRLDRGTPSEAPNKPEIPSSLIRALLDIADSLRHSGKQVEKARQLALTAIGSHSVTPVPTRTGFWSRWFGSSPPAAPIPVPVVAPRDVLTPLLAGLADGYAMSLRRIERLFPEYEIVPFATMGQPFDPETMEVLEAIEATDQVSGVVVDEIRPGYTWKGTLFRSALVRVAR